MSKNKGLHISKEELFQNLEAFIKQIDSNYDMTTIQSKELNPNNHQTRYDFIIGSQNFKIDIYYNNSKTITIYPTGDEQSKNFGADFIRFVQDNMNFKDVAMGTFSCKIEENVFQELKKYLTSLQGVTITKEEDKGMNGHIVQIISEIGDIITLTYYISNKTLYFQGYLMNLHVETKSFLGAYTAYVKTQVPTAQAHQDITIDNSVKALINTYLNQSYANLDPLLQDFIYDALKHTAIRATFKDYASWSFPALKALEGRIKQIFSFYGVRITNQTGFTTDDGTGNYVHMFDFVGRHTLKSIIPITDVNAINNLNDCYTYLAKNRNPLFHTNQNLAVSRRIEKPEVAEDIIYRICRLIEKSYVDLGR